jgi:hypothetical protein
VGFRAAAHGNNGGVQTDIDRVRAAAQRSEEVDWLGRAGLVSQGVLYAVLAILATQVAFEGRDSSHRPDAEGALQLVTEQPLGPALLIVLALGFVAYAFWRIVEAVADRDREGSGWKGVLKRAGYLVLGLLYLALATLAVTTAFGSGGGAGGEEQRATQGVLSWPLGRPLVLALGVGFLVGAGASVVYVLLGKLDDKLQTSALSSQERRLVSLTGVVGYSARAVVFAIIGAFLVKAAWQHDPSETRGLDGALLELTQAPFGPVVLGAVALGFLAFAAWCGTQARYRRI